MGEGIEFVCGKCGFRKEIWYGPGFLSNPLSLNTRAETLGGKYGVKPKKIIEEHPDAECSWYKPLFHCSCGNISTKNAVIIFDEDKPLYRPSMKCGLCGRKMWEIAEPPDYLPCPKCGEQMMCNLTVLWD